MLFISLLFGHFTSPTQSIIFNVPKQDILPRRPLNLSIYFPFNSTLARYSSCAHMAREFRHLNFKAPHLIGEAYGFAMNWPEPTAAVASLLLPLLSTAASLWHLRCGLLLLHCLNRLSSPQKDQQHFRFIYGAWECRFFLPNSAGRRGGPPCAEQKQHNARHNNRAIKKKEAAPRVEQNDKKFKSTSLHKCLYYLHIDSAHGSEVNNNNQQQLPQQLSCPSPASACE